MSRPGNVPPPSLALPLDRLRGSVRGLVGLRGFGVVLAALSAMVAADYALDRALDLPRLVRLALLGTAGISLSLLAYRVLLRPLLRPLPHDDVALLVERAFPELRERLVSAVQLTRRASPPGESRALVEALRGEAERSLASLPVRRTLDPRRPLFLALAAAALAAGVAAHLGRDRERSLVFLARLFGADRPWPKRTFLEIHLPERTGAVRVETEPGWIRARVPVGSDLPVRVVARGVVPAEVRLHVRGERSRPATRTGPEEFVYAFRSVIAPFAFHATGGDDEDEDPIVEVRPHRPPEIASVAVDLSYPAYTGLPAGRKEGGSFEALVGTAARLTIVGTAGATAGSLRFQKTGAEIRLEPAGPSFTASFPVEATDRYLVSLEDGEGLTTPEPGSYTVVAIPDRRPELRVLAPDRSDLDVTPNGAFPVRAVAKDDFGLRSLDLRLGIGKETELGAFSLLAEPPTTLPAQTPPPLGREARGSRRVEVAAVAAPEGASSRPARDGDTITFYVEATDNRPEPNRTESARFRAIVLPPAEILRKLNDGIARVKDDVESLGRIQREKIDRLNDLLGALEGDARAAAERYSFVSASVGQGRVTAQARRIEADFLHVFESGSYNRLDRAADAAIAAIEAVDGEVFALLPPRAKGAEEEAPTATSRAEALLRRYRGGELGALEFLGKVLDMLDLAHAIAGNLSPKASRALEEAATAVDPGKVRVNLATARASQDEILATVDRLLVLLGEWDNYQAVVGLAREILEGQKTLNQRTKEFTKRH